jgi:hypothetical protein
MHRFIQVPYFIWQLSLVSFRRFAHVQRKLRRAKSDKIARCDAYLQVEENYFQYVLKIPYCLKKRGSQLTANCICGERRATNRQGKRAELSSDAICRTYKHLYSCSQSHHLKSILIIILRQLAASSGLTAQLASHFRILSLVLGQVSLPLSLSLSLSTSHRWMSQIFSGNISLSSLSPFGFHLDSSHKAETVVLQYSFMTKVPLVHKTYCRQ